MQVLGNHRITALSVLILTVTSLVPVSRYGAAQNWTSPALSTSTAHAMVPFTSYDQLHQWVLTMTCNGPGDCKNGSPPTPVFNCVCLCPEEARFPVTLFAASGASNPVPNHSGTNAQVTGVDELDMVKNDGTYVYTVTNNSVAIVLAYPVTDATLLARVAVNGSIQGIFIAGDKLVVISQPSQPTPYCYMGMGIAQPGMGASLPIAFSQKIFPYPIYPSAETTSLWIFDLSNHSSPVLTTTVVMNGTIAGARLIGNYAYLVATQSVYGNINGTILFPETVVNGQAFRVTPEDVYHSDVADYAHSFTSVLGIDITQPNPTPSSRTFLIGTSSTIYVSLNQIYLTEPVWGQYEETAIHRVNVYGASIQYEATGTVQGHLLNQFSMDEYNGYFRVATTDSGYSQVEPGQSTASIGWPQQETNVYVLDSSLHIVGSLQGLSPGEVFYAARFFGDRAYLVTFQRIDPLFVINLQDPQHPTVLGQLNITGVSDYLQPYDENHLIGFGKSSINVTWENAALFQGLKLSLFDVTDPSNPVDTSNFLVGDRGSDSPALTDHKSVLFDRSLNLLVIPVEITMAQQNATSLWAYNPAVWQGAYVFNVTPQGGIVFRRGITHLPAGELPGWNNSNLSVTRVLYIGNVLYTISNNTVMMNSLSDLSQFGSVSLA